MEHRLDRPDEPTFMRTGKKQAKHDNERETYHERHSGRDHVAVLRDGGEDTAVVGARSSAFVSDSGVSDADWQWRRVHCDLSIKVSSFGLTALWRRVRVVRMMRLSGLYVQQTREHRSQMWRTGASCH